MHAAWVYIITNKYNTVVYIGVTTDLATRLWEHREKQDVNSFSARYNLYKLVYYEGFELLTAAIGREKFLKKKTRSYKNALINAMNPGWEDLTRIASAL